MNIKILWVEDNENTVHSREEIFKSINIDLHWEIDKRNIKKVIQRNEFNIVFLDLLLLKPRKQHWTEIFWEIRLKCPRTPIVAVTAHEKMFKEEIANVDFDEKLPKPFPLISSEKFLEYRRTISYLSTNDWPVSVLKNMAAYFGNTHNMQPEASLYLSNRVAKMAIKYIDRFKDMPGIVYKISNIINKTYIKAAKSPYITGDISDSFASYASYWKLYSEHAMMECIRNNVEIQKN